ncbi:TIGR00297 family protein [Phormidium tenue FACHB-886]|nr:TIGR00297 family protein [Phormidium tenue FACHB-886]
MLTSLDSVVALDVLMPWAFAVGLNAVLLTLVWFAPKKLLTPAGIIHAGILGTILWGTLGWRGYAVMVFYFLAGSAVTRIGIKEKEAAGIAEKRSGARGPENVWGSALVGTVCALAIYALTVAPYSWTPQVIFLLLLAYVASICTKLSDTFATEIGKAYGKHTFLITTLKPVERGTEGAVSLEGTLAGIVGSALLATVGWAVQLITPINILYCLIAAFIATTIESLIGATIEGKVAWLTHDVVNVLNTLIGAILAVAIAVLVQLTLNA